MSAHVRLRIMYSLSEFFFTLRKPRDEFRSYIETRSQFSVRKWILVCEVAPNISTLPFGEVASAGLTMRVKMHPLMRDGRNAIHRDQRDEFG
jgi:hypothetical protein